MKYRLKARRMYTLRSDTILNMYRVNSITLSHVNVSKYILLLLLLFFGGSAFDYISCFKLTDLFYSLLPLHANNNVYYFILI